MSGLAQELLYDATMNRIDIDTYSDFAISIQKVLLSGVFTKKDATILDLYLCGYTVNEIALQQNETTDVIIDILRRLFIAIEETSGYTDDGFIQKIQVKYKHRPASLERLRLYLQQRSVIFA